MNIKTFNLRVDKLIKQCYNKDKIKGRTEWRNRMFKRTIEELNIIKAVDNYYAEVVFEKGEERSLAEACKSCPAADSCKSLELWWGCGFWEDDLGEDV